MYIKVGVGRLAGGVRKWLWRGEWEVEKWYVGLSLGGISTPLWEWQ